ncbi:hypothetical protein TraAM80_06103 [Trypanosoma rangeli]|uniref:Uncharacterized protein n=1 Tax=Trypanosoma rangeli TaxID=5698 RepID=A0A3R7K786_TRYRA|nr:uncharacterized protein TraAM80_06103 [Trypanosoma rangeli]RNF02900.1 hypothetical protein TraAM80_06103 [Trypanosoma rangeli]|eukprot:RNF02900.1 hypothetical protein TraAM80_06103 [Trypanosoma rangeli]
MSDCDTAALAALQQTLDACEGSPFQTAVLPCRQEEGEEVRPAPFEGPPPSPPAAAQLPTVKRHRTNNTAILPHVFSPDRLRMKTYLLHKEIQALSMQHERRHERLLSIRASRSASRSFMRTGNTHYSGNAPFTPRSSNVLPDHAHLQHKKERGPALPNLLKCFEEARTRYLVEGERRKRAMPPVYSSQIPRTAEAAWQRQDRNLMKNPDAFGLRFFSQSYLKEAGQL